MVSKPPIKPPSWGTIVSLASPLLVAIVWLVALNFRAENTEDDLETHIKREMHEGGAIAVQHLLLEQTHIKEDISDIKAATDDLDQKMDQILRRLEASNNN